MRFCPPHWDALRHPIADLGMDGMVARSGQELGERLTQGDFEPLMFAHNMIVSNALRLLGLPLMVGEKCPICELTTQHEATCQDPACAADFEQWIDRAAQDARAEWRRLNPNPGAAPDLGTPGRPA